MRPSARRVSVVAFLALLGFLVAAPGLPAQTVTGTVQGTVTDSSGGVVARVRVRLDNVETGQERTVVTNDVGFYVAPFLPLGVYRATATLSGFGTVIRENIEVTLNETRVVDFTLDPTVRQEVTVTAEASRINTTNQEIKGSLTEREIMDRPLANPGSFLALAEYFPGFQENPTSGQNNPTASSGSSINFNGTGTRGATFQINGVNNDDSSENQNRQGAAASTIKEFQVITNSYSAEFGRGYGAVVLVQTKSGTNAVHGDVYEYYQNSKLNARSFFTPRTVPKAHLPRHEYGFTLGGPIRQNLLFGFVNADRTELTGQNGIARDFFLPAELTMPRLTRGNDTPANRAFIESVLRRYPAFVNNDARSPRTFSTNFGIDWPDRDYSARVDFQPSGVHHAFVRWQYTRQIRANEEIIVGEQTHQNNKQANVGLTYTTVFSPRVVGEFRYGLGKRSTRVDIKSGNDTPIIRFAGSPVAGTIIGNAGQFPISRDQMDNQFVYNVTAVFGSKHSFKAGTDTRLQQLDDFADDFSRGFWNFGATCGGVSYGTGYRSFLDGCISAYTKNFGPFFLENRINESNVYAEDNWRVTPNLTLNLGIRYEYVQAPYEVEDRIDYIFGDDTDNLEPRVGFAWSPGWDSGRLKRITGGAGNASVRGGYGVYHGRIFQSVFSQGGASVRTNPPNALRTSWSNSLNVADPTNGFVFVPGPQTLRHQLVLPDENLEMPATHQWNLSMERTIPFNSTVRLTYTGTRGDALIRYTNSNLPLSPLAGPVVVANHPNNAPLAGFPDLRGKTIDRIAADYLCAGTGLPGITINATCPQAVPIADNEIGFRVPRTNERRPDPRYSTNIHVTNGGDSWYHGFQTEWIRRFSRGLYFTVNYTWSKAIDTVSEATFVGAGDTNFTGNVQKFAKAHSRFHTPHRLTFSGSYRLPFFRDRRDLLEAALGGWQLSGIIRLASGTPFTVVDGSARDLNFDGTAERPVLLDASILGRSVDHPSRSQAQLPLAAFRPALAGDFDKNLVGRNTFYLDGTNTVDLVIQKNFRLAWSGDTLQVRGEMYNALNTAQFGFPTTDINVLTFGRITGMAARYTPRVIQFVVRYRF
jgi:outer membrane receptor protein involved in Fe transport